jgi:hypothetical protein
MFNAIIRDDDIPADPISDPITDPCVLPIQTGSLSFGLGAQLKNAVRFNSPSLLLCCSIHFLSCDFPGVQFIIMALKSNQQRCKQ